MKINKLESPEREFFIIGLYIPFVLSAIAILYFLLLQNYEQYFECLFWKIWGIYCPGCGGTRAIKALLKGQFLLALWYHPFVIYCFGIYIAFMGSNSIYLLGFKKKRGMTYRNCYIWLGITIVVLNFIIKNFLKFKYNICM